MRGEDADFDYTQVDNESVYDGAESRRDAEDVYYDDESPSSTLKAQAETGVQDF